MINAPSVLIADDHSLVAEALRKLLESEYAVLDIARNGRQVLEMAEALQPDVIVLDVSMPELGGLAVLEELRRKNSRSRVLILTMHQDTQYAARAFQLGADGFLRKSSPSHELLMALSMVLQGLRYVPPDMQEDLSLAAGSSGTDEMQDLTHRQRQVLTLVAEGKTAKEIADLLGISFRTVEGHKAIIMKQLGLQSTADIVRYAVKIGLVDVQ
ncbi:MAG: response regulator transcription factor [Pirellula sp.]|jgi:DNA-binding NarL/FixJ family response regulator|nr:response regulator transcription factor [Pirellula sp.]